MISTVKMSENDVFKSPSGTESERAKVMASQVVLRLASGSIINATASLSDLS